jgi:hypothetical protein
MPNPNQETQRDSEAYWPPEVDLGGADNVQKTTYVRGAGTEPDRSSEGPIAAVPSHAPSALVAVLVTIAIVAAIVYLVGLAGR